MKTKLKSLPQILVVCICLVILSIGISGKEGYHMDELLSYELSNALFNPWIVPTQPQGRLSKFVENEITGDSFFEKAGLVFDNIKDVIQNRGNSKMLSYSADVYDEPVWISGDDFKNYITVGSGDAFNYLSVYFNVKDDNHPPVHFALLHTVSSIFRGSASPWIGCSINLVAIVGILLLLMKLGKIFAGLFGMSHRGEFTGLFCMILFGLSTGAMATTLLVRMYGVLTFFCVALFYIHMDKFRHDNFKEKNLLLILVTVLGFLTQYFFLFYCLVLALVTGVILLAEKKYKDLFIYARSMIIAAAAGIICFPFAISDVFSSGRGVEALENLSRGFGGYGNRIISFMGIIGSRTIGLGLILLITVLMLVLLIIKRVRLKENGYIKWMAVLVLPVVAYVLLAARMSPYMVDRYVMPVFPFVVLTGGISIVKLCDKYSNRIFLGVCAGVFLWQAYSLANYDGEYMYKGYSRQEKISEDYCNLNCICLYEGVGYYENLLEFTNYKNTLLLTGEEFISRNEEESIKQQNELILLVKDEISDEKLREITGRLEAEYGFITKDVLLESTDSVYNDKIILFEKAEM